MTTECLKENSLQTKSDNNASPISFKQFLQERLNNEAETAGL